MKGPAPKPSRLKDLHGRPGHHPINRQEPEPLKMPGLPDPPDFLDAIGAAEWLRVGPELLRLGLLTAIDTSAFAAYCMTYSKVVTIEMQLTKGETGLVCIGENGNPFINPLMNVQSGALKQLKSYLTLFGMDPSSRTRIKVPDAPKEDPFENFLARGGLRSLPKVKK